MTGTQRKNPDQSASAEATATGLIKIGQGRYFCPVVLPYFRFHHANDRLSAWRRELYNWQAEGRRKHSLRPLRYALTWPFTVIRLTIQADRLWGREVARLHDISRWRQVCDMLRLGLRDNISVVSYYLFQLWRPQRRGLATSYIQNFEGWWLLERLHAGQDIQNIDDKLKFNDFCLRHNLPTAPVILEVAPDGQVEWRHSTQDIPGTDLFAKNAGLGAGKLASAYTWSAARNCWFDDDRSYTQADLLDRLRQWANGGRIVLQQRLTNHPDIADLGPKALCTLRAVTCMANDASAEYFRSAWRMPVGEALTDHPVNGGLAAPVDASGRLGPAIRNVVGPSLARHPDSGAAIAGRALPQFEAMIQLAIRAHEAFGLIGMVGWDIALIESGPILIEGNTVWGTDLMQTTSGEPLGDTIFIDLLAALERHRQTSVESA